MPSQENTKGIETLFPFPQRIAEDHLPTCKMGQGELCCRYLVFTDGFACAKRTSLAFTLDARVRAESITARGDNCDGWPPRDA